MSEVAPLIRLFDALPPAARDHLYRRLHDVLTGKEQSQEFASLSRDDRTSLLEILLDTKSGLPDYWKVSPRSLKQGGEANPPNENVTTVKR